MAINYTLNWTDDNLKAPFTLKGNTIDTTVTSIALTGKGCINWGEREQEDLLHLLENFASSGIPPSSPTVGQEWFDASSHFLNVYTASGWEPLAYRRIDSATPPTGPNYPGSLWYDTTADLLKIYTNRGEWAWLAQVPLNYSSGSVTTSTTVTPSSTTTTTSTTTPTSTRLSAQEYLAMTPGTPTSGGYYVGMVLDSGVAYALIVAPKSGGETYATYQSYSGTTSGADSEFNGLTNSNNLNNSSHPASKWCCSLSLGGYTDWYLPAKNELEMMYRYLKPTNDTNDTSSGANVSIYPSNGNNYTALNPRQTTATAFKSGGSEAFNTTAGNYYYSSTCASSGFVWVQSFINGLQTDADKTYSRLIRAVRRVEFTVAELTA